MKKIVFLISFILGVTFFQGCVTTESKEDYVVTTNMTMKVNFNQEDYVWEQLYFPTNRVMDRK